MESGSASKKRFWEYPAVKVLPSLRGVRVISGKHGGEQLVGEWIPWYRVRMQSTHGFVSIWVLGVDGQPLHVGDRRLNASFERGGSLARRIQDRHARKWALRPREPIHFEPARQPRIAILVIMVVLIACSLYAVSRFITGIWGALSFPPSTLTDVIGLAAVVVAGALPVAFTLLAWKLCPRPRSFAEADLLPTGLVGRTFDGRTVPCIFERTQGLKLTRGNPAILRFMGDWGERYWIAATNPVAIYLGNAVSPPECSQAETVGATVRHFRRIGIRLMILGPVLSASMFALVNWLTLTGQVLPSQVPMLQRACVLAPSLSILLGLQLIFVAWRHSKRGRRTLKRVRARLPWTRPSPFENT